MPYLNEPYIKVKDNSITVDRNLANFDIINYKIVNGIYQSQMNVISELQNSGLEVTDDTAYNAPKNIELMAQFKLPFKDLFELYCKIKDVEPMYSLTPNYKLELIESRNPLIKEAFEKLGKDEVRRMNYHQSNIKREIIKKSKKTTDYKTVDMIDNVFPFQTAIPVKKIKNKLQDVYSELGIKETAKATDLKK